MTIERQAHRATVNVVLICSFALTVVRAGRTITDVRRALSLRKLDATVAALIERALRSDIHAVQEHVSLLFFRSRARIVRPALAAAMRGLASHTVTCFFYEVRAFEHDKARRAVEANLAD